MLILFDIDMTMISTGGSGMKALGDAGRELYGHTFTTDGIDFAGRLDPLIIGEMLVNNGLEPSHENRLAIRTAYAAQLARRLTPPSPARALPGVLSILERLRESPGVTLGLLTGNFEETGSMKLRACGIDPAWFQVCVWGDDSPHDPPRREHLVPVGIERCNSQRAEPVSGSLVTVIGDTPHDVQCARAHSCRSLGVATGRSSLTHLEAAGADLVLPDLSETGLVLDWLLKGHPAESRR